MEKARTEAMKAGKARRAKTGEFPLCKTYGWLCCTHTRFYSCFIHIHMYVYSAKAQLRRRSFVSFHLHRAKISSYIGIDSISAFVLLCSLLRDSYTARRFRQHSLDVSSENYGKFDFSIVRTSNDTHKFYVNRERDTKRSLAALSLVRFCSVSVFPQFSVSIQHNFYTHI